MLVVLSDTHGRDDPQLAGRTREAVEGAEVLLHAGDFVTPAVLDSFVARADLRAVHGNADRPPVRERLPAERVVAHGGFRIALAHGHEHTDVSLSLFARQSNADLVVVGHTHRPGFDPAPAVPVLNPGSHADPRGNDPAHAELSLGDDTLDGRLVRPDGSHIESFSVPSRAPG